MNTLLTQIASQQRTADHLAAAERSRLARGVRTARPDTSTSGRDDAPLASVCARRRLVWLRLRSRQS